MLMDYVQGGELFGLIYNVSTKGYLSNDAAAFYGACLSEALSHLHSRNICHRDLKPGEFRQWYTPSLHIKFITLTHGNHRLRAYRTCYCRTQKIFSLMVSPSIPGSNSLQILDSSTHLTLVRRSLAAGYVVLADFGFAKIVLDSTFTTCGSPEYMGKWGLTVDMMLPTGSMY